MVAECDGHVFTAHREGRFADADIFREPWMQPHQIVVSGDKGQFAQLTQRPRILLDDHERNIDLLRRRCTAHELDGIGVRRRLYTRRPMQAGYTYAWNPLSWPQHVRNFRDQFQYERSDEPAVVNW